MKYALIVIFLVLSVSAKAGELVRNAEIVLVGNPANGGYDFFNHN